MRRASGTEGQEKRKSLKLRVKQSTEKSPLTNQSHSKHKILLEMVKDREAWCAVVYGLQGAEYN